MQETPILIFLIKKYLWEFILGAVCLTMLHNFIENIGGDTTKTRIAKAMINGLYASVFFSGIGGYYFNEVGLVGGIFLGTAVGLGGVKEIANTFIDLLKGALNKN